MPTSESGASKPERIVKSFTNSEVEIGKYIDGFF